MDVAAALGNANLQGSVFVEADLTWANLTNPLAKGSPKWPWKMGRPL
jgi:hypothetical protein